MATFFKDMFAPQGKPPGRGGSGAAASSGATAAAPRPPNPAAPGGASSARFFNTMFASSSKPSNTSESAELQELRRMPFPSLAPDAKPPAVVEAFLANHGRRRGRDEPSTPAPESSDPSLALAQELGLGMQFFETEFDVVEHVLQAYPEGRDAQDTFLVEHLAKYNEHLEVVKRTLVETVQLHQTPLVEGMRQVQLIDMDLTRATINVKNARRRLSVAQEALVRGDLRVVLLHRRRERAREAAAHVRTLQRLAARSQAMAQVAASGDVPTAVQECVETVREIDEQPAALQALRGLRAGLVAALPRLRVQSDEALMQLLSSDGDLEQYERVVRSYFVLDGAVEMYRGANANGRSDAFGAREELNADAIRGLPARLRRMLVSQAEKALREQFLALLRDLEVAREVVHLDTTAAAASGTDEGGEGAESDATIEDEDEGEGAAGAEAEAGDPARVSASRAAGLGLKELCALIPTREAPRPSLVRRMGFAYEAICEAVTNYNAFCDWHVRLAARCRDDRDALRAISSADGPEAEAAVLQRLETIANDLGAGKRAAWSGVLSQLSVVCASEAFRYPAMKLHSFNNLVKLTDVLSVVSQVFGGDKSVLEMRAFQRELCKSYCTDFHRDCVEVLRSFVMREQWAPINVSLDSLGGAAGLLRRGAAKHLLRSTSGETDDAAIDAAHRAAKARAGAISQEGFAGPANPFRALNEKAREASVAAAAAAAAEGEPPSAPPVADMPAFEVDEAALGSEPAVLTTTVVNCIAKDLGNYVQVIESVSGVAKDTLLNLQELFCAYLYHVLTNFVPVADLYAIFDRPNSLRGQQYAALRSTMVSMREKLGADTMRVRLPQAPAVPGAASSAGGPSGREVSSSRVPSRLLGRQSSGKAFGRGPGISRDSRRASAPQVAASAAGPTPSRIPGRLATLVEAEAVEKDGVAPLEPQGLGDDAVRARIVAAESIAFAQRLLESIRARIERALPAVEREQLVGKLFSEVAGQSRATRELVYRGVARALMERFAAELAGTGQTPPGGAGGSTGSVVRLVTESVAWGRIHSLQSEASAYVGKAALQLRKAWVHLQRESKEGSVFPIVAISRVWDAVVQEAMEQMLDGFAQVQGCTTEGRALMSLDLATLFRELRDVAPCGDEGSMAKLRVDDYIKAFYYDREEDVLEWARANRDKYERWHLHNLVAFGVAAGKPQAQRQRLLQALDSRLGGGGSGGGGGGSKNAKPVR